MNIDELRDRVHRKYDYSEYDSTNVKRETNCYSHAIGSTATHREWYRVGAICGEKNVKQQYFSADEIERLFFKDLEVLKLKCTKINLSYDETSSFVRDEAIRRITNYQLSDDEHIVLLFVKYNADRTIRDFHFMRYDDRGFSEKRWMTEVIFIENPKQSWPMGEFTKFYGAYILSK